MAGLVATINTSMTLELRVDTAIKDQILSLLSPIFRPAILFISHLADYAQYFCSSPCN